MDFSEWYNRIIKEAELCDLRYGVKGMVVFRPWSVITMEYMYDMYEEELRRRGHQPVWFPAFISEKNLTKEKEHVEGFSPEVFWVTEAGENKLEERYVLRPTSETAMYPLYALWINGVKDLPLKLYQRCSVWRYETKATKPFIRSREFYWIEAHCAFASEKEARAQVKEDIEITAEVMEKKFGIPFLFFKRPEWDKFAGAVETYAADTLMPDNRVLQLPSTHLLGQNFSKTFGIRYMDVKGNHQYAWQTCYGPCISRMYAALISVHGDEKGLVLPFELSPIQVMIIPILKKGNEKKVLDYCGRIEKRLMGFRVKTDDDENTPGFKFNHWEMKGVPIRIEVGEKEIKNNSVMVARRDGGKKEVKTENIVEFVKRAANEMSELIRKRAQESFKKRIHQAKDMKELKERIEHGLVRVAFCTDEKKGEDCAEEIKHTCSGNVRGSLVGEEKPEGECIICGKSANVYLYIGRQY